MGRFTELDQASVESQAERWVVYDDSKLVAEVGAYLAASLRNEVRPEVTNKKEVRTLPDHTITAARDRFGDELLAQLDKIDTGRRALIPATR